MHMLEQQGSAGAVDRGGQGPDSAAGELERLTIAKAVKNLVPLIVICYFIAYLDRTNIGIAALQMNKDLGMTASMFGFGAGLFFLFYFSMEVPSNLLMTRYGVRRWVARIMVSWGFVAGGMAFVRGPTSFYFMRALLGLAEAGFFPAMVFYLTQWFPSSYRGRAISYLQVAGPLSYLIGAPISGTLLGLDGLLGLRGWQWMFILEAVPAIILSVVVLARLPDTPADARWLTDDQRDWLVARLTTEEEQRRSVREYTVVQAMFSPRVLVLGLVHFSIVLSVFGVGFFLPQIVKEFGLTNAQTGLVSAIPYVAGSVGILWWGRRSDAKGERRLHTAIPLALASVALVGAGLTGQLELKMLAFSVAAFGAYGCVSAFWTLPSIFLSGASIAGAIAIISCIGALGGFAGPWIMGVVKDITGNFSAALMFLAGMDAVAVFAVLALPGFTGSSQRERDTTTKTDK